MSAAALFGFRIMNLLYRFPPESPRASHDSEVLCLKCKQIFTFLFFFVVVVAISWAAPAAYGGSQARGPIGAVATGLRQRHSNAGSEPRLQPTPQLTATPDR